MTKLKPAWKRKRQSRRIQAALDRASDNTPKIIPRKPVAPVVLFFLDKIRCKVGNGVVKGVNVPVVFLRDVQTRRIKVRGRMVEQEHFGKWRPFSNAEPALPSEGCTMGTHIGIKAPLTAWAASGLLDGMVQRDLPRDERKPYEFRKAA